MSQLIISIGRESGSGGLEIARALAKRFGLPLYDKSILQNAAEAKGLDAKDLEQYDERPRSPLFYRSIKGFSNAPEDGVALFVEADLDFRIRRTPLPGNEALEFIHKQDRKRRIYHDQHCKGDWGDAQSYDLVINSARLGVPGTADVLEHYIRARQAHLDSQTDAI